MLAWVVSHFLEMRRRHAPTPLFYAITLQILEYLNMHAFLKYKALLSQM